MRLHGGALLPLVIGCKEMIRCKLPMQHDGVERAESVELCLRALLRGWWRVPTLAMASVCVPG